MTLFTAKQIHSKPDFYNWIVKGMVPADHGLTNKLKPDWNLQQTIGKQRRTRRSSFMLKEAQRPWFRIRPSSKKLPPLNDRNKETLSKKEIILNKTLLDIPPPFVTCRWWAVANATTGEIIFGKLEKEIREIASLTKIMVCMTVIRICK